MLLSFSAGTDVQWNGKEFAELYITADNVLNTAYQNHLNRLKYADMNIVTGRRGVYNMGRNVTFKLVVPLSL
jgi:iron complex outermembrane receptor protein